MFHSKDAGRFVLAGGPPRRRASRLDSITPSTTEKEQTLALISIMLHSKFWTRTTTCCTQPLSGHTEQTFYPFSNSVPRQPVRKKNRLSPLTCATFASRPLGVDELLPGHRQRPPRQQPKQGKAVRLGRCVPEQAEQRMRGCLGRPREGPVVHGGTSGEPPIGKTHGNFHSVSQNSYWEVDLEKDGNAVDTITIHNRDAGQSLLARATMTFLDDNRDVMAIKKLSGANEQTFTVPASRAALPGPSLPQRLPLLQVSVGPERAAACPTTAITARTTKTSSALVEPLTVCAPTITRTACLEPTKHGKPRHAQRPPKYGYNVESCQNACKEYKYFSLQHNGWCSCEDDEAPRDQVRHPRATAWAVAGATTSTRTST